MCTSVSPSLGPPWSLPSTVDPPRPGLPVPLCKTQYSANSFIFEPLSSLTFHGTHFSFVLLSPQFGFWTFFLRCTAGLSSGSSSLTYVSHVHVLRNSCLPLSSFLLSHYFPFTTCTVEFSTHLCLQMAANIVPPAVIPRLRSAEPTTYGRYMGILGSQSVSWVHLFSSSSLYPISLTNNNQQHKAQAQHLGISLWILLI